MRRNLGIVVFVALVSVVASMGIVQASPDSLVVNAAWNDSLSDGDLTYKVSGGDETVRDIVRAAVEEWETAVAGLTLTEIFGNTKPNVDIKFKRGGGSIQGQALYSFDDQGLIKSVKINISGKAFGDANNADTVAQITKHEFAHALGIGHADFSGDLMSTTVTAGTGVISACDVNGVIAAQHWKLVDGTSPHQPHVGSINCAVALTHDVAVTGVTAPSTAVEGDTVSVSVAVANQGTSDETFDVTLTDTTADEVIATTTVTSLASGTSTDVPFSWPTAGASLGGHVLTATASLGTDEDTANNTATATVTLTDGTATVYHVASMAFDVDKKGPWYRLTATMTIEDADSATVGEGLTVTGSISREGRTFLYTVTTDASGQVQFRLRTQFTETLYTVEVAGVDDGAGGAFDSDTGQACKTITIHNNATFTEGTCV